jgi:hypothetical protein
MKEQSNELTVPKSVTVDLSQIGSWSVDRKDVLSLVMQEKEEALLKAKKAFEDEHPEIVSAIHGVQSHYKKQFYESMTKNPAVSDFMNVTAYANVLLSRDKIDSYLKDTVLPNHPTITKGLTSIVDTYSSIAPNAQITHSIRIDGFYGHYRSGKSRSKYKAEEYKIVVPRRGTISNMGRIIRLPSRCLPQ